MKIKSILPAIAGLFFVAFAVAQVYGVAGTGEQFAQTKEAKALMKTMEQIDLEAENASDDIDVALEDVDEILDGNPSNEDEILELRDGLVAMRIAATATAPEKQSTRLVGTYSSVGGGGYSGYSSGYSGSCNTCSSSGGGSVFSGGGGGLLSGGGQIRRFWPLLGLVALAAIDGDDDADPASVPANVGNAN